MTALTMATTDRRRAYWFGCATAFAAVLAFTAFMWAWGRPSDWLIARDAGRLLVDGHLDVYVRMPEAQMGPLALALAGLLPDPVYVLVGAALLPVFLIFAAEGRVRWMVLGATVLSFPWAFITVTGHLDDLLVLVGAAGIVRFLQRDKGLIAAAFFVLAIAGKPTAIVLVPLLFIRSWRSGLVALGVGGLVWAPFVLNDVHGFLDAGRGIAHVWPGSVPWMLGAPIAGEFPAWVRPTQLLLGVVLCVLVGRRVSLEAAVVTVFLVRAALEPAPWASYTAAVMALAFLVDRGRRRPALAIVPLFLVMLYTFGQITPAAGLLRLVLFWVAAAGVLVRTSSADEAGVVDVEDLRIGDRGREVEQVA